MSDSGVVACEGVASEALPRRPDSICGGSPAAIGCSRSRMLVSHTISWGSEGSVSPPEHETRARTEQEGSLYSSSWGLSGSESASPQKRGASESGAGLLATKGISLAGLRKLRERIKVLCAEGFFKRPYVCHQPCGEGVQLPQVQGSASTIYELSIRQLMFALAGSQSREGACLVDNLEWVQPEDVGVPTYFISHVWACTVGSLMDGVESYMSNIADGTCMWIDFLAMSMQHRQAPLQPSLVRSVVAACRGGVVAVVNCGSGADSKSSPSRCAWTMLVWDQTLRIHGTDGLHMVNVTPTDWDQLIRCIDINAAICTFASDKAAIMDTVLELYGSCKAFNQTLSLQLLLRPLSYSIDLTQLWRRSEGTEWRLNPVMEWLAREPSENRALCVMAGAGTGKSTISAAILVKLFGSDVLMLGEERQRNGGDDRQPVISALHGEHNRQPVISAHHFLKYNDQRRLEPLRIVQTLAFQIARRDRGGTVSSLDNLELFATRLLQHGYEGTSEMDRLLELMTIIKEPVYILIDALDEGDPPEQVPGFSGTVLACGNKAMQLITRYLSILPPNFRFIFTSRPEALCYGMEAALSRSFIGLELLQPWELRQGEEGEAMGQHPRVLVCETVVKECLAGEDPPLLQADEVMDGMMLPLYSAYLQTFRSCEQRSGGASKEEIMPLLQALMAAQEPLSRSLLQRTGLLPFMESLPGWGVLIYLADHHVYQLHKSLQDWLLDPIAAHEYHVDVGAGHLLLGKHLMNEVLQCTREHPPSLYTLNYVFVHLAGACGTYGASGVQLMEASEMLDTALRNWDFLRHVFQVGAAAANMVRALGSIPRHDRSTYTDDAFLWTRRLFHDLVAQPDNMERITLSGCPLTTLKYKEALEKVKPEWITKMVFGGSGGEWPPDQAILKGHTDWLYSLAYSPDGRQLASSSKDGTIWLWDLANGQIRAKLEGHGGIVLNVTFNPNGKQLASSGDDHSVRLWDLASGMCTAVLHGHTSWVYRVAYSPDGMQLASAGCDLAIKLWDVASEECTRTLLGHTDFVYGVAYSPGGHVLASASKDETIRIWDPATGDCTMVLRGHTKEVFSVAFRPDGSQLGSASYDRTVKLWDMTSGDCVMTLRGHMNIVLSVSFSPDMTQLASTGSDLTLKLWSLESGECLDTFLGHTDACFSAAYSPDGMQLASASADRTVRLWDLSRASKLEGHSSWIHSVTFSPNGTWLASCSRDETIKLWDVATGQCTATLRGHTDVVHCVSIRPAGDLLVSASLDNTLRVWDVQSGQMDSTLELVGHTNGVICVAFSPDGKRLASGSMDSSIMLWELESGACLGTLAGHNNTVWSVAFSPDGKVLASAAADNKVKLWAVSSQECLATLHGHTHHVIWLAFRPDGCQLASSSSDHTIKVWDLKEAQGGVVAKSGQHSSSNMNCCMTLKGHSDFVQSISYSPDGKRLASGSKDKTVMVWDIETGDSIATLTGHSGWVYSVAYSPDGQRIVSSSADGTLRLWEQTLLPEQGFSS